MYHLQGYIHIHEITKASIVTLYGVIVAYLSPTASSSDDESGLLSLEGRNFVTSIPFLFYVLITSNVCMYNV